MANIATLPDGKIADFIDGKIRNDTPEEYVRQNLERRLVLELSYPAEMIGVEVPIRMGSGKPKRVDIVVYGEGEPKNQTSARILVECKKETIKPTDKTEGVDQLKSYMAACPNAEWGLWTNGRYRAVFRKVIVDGTIEYEEPNDIPSRHGNTDEIDRPTRDDLKFAIGDNLLFAFKTCHDHIYVTDGMQKQPAFFELLKVIFCKIHDERNIPKPLEFYTTAKEKASQDGRLAVFGRISRIFDAVKKRYPTIFDPSDAIKLQPRSMAYIVSELQRYSFLATDIDVKGKAYEEVVGANLRGDRGEFFTPRNVQKMAVEMLSLKPDERLLDPACGTGGFLVNALTRIADQLHEHSGPGMSTAWKGALDQRIHEIAQQNFFGIDINPDLVKATKMNMVMNNDGSGNILRQDSLLHPHQWDDDFKKQLASALGIDKAQLRGPSSLAHFDVIATNPPFGSKLPVNDQETLRQYALGHVWREVAGRWEQTTQIATSMPPEILFIERCWQFLKPGGRMAIVLPDAILGAPGLSYVRQWIVEHSRIIASVDLHPDTFQPRNGTQTSVLILQRKTESETIQEQIAGQLRDYEIFMAQVFAIGHDKRGNRLYRRNEEGEEILVADDSTGVLLERTATGTTTRRQLPAQKIPDDDTPIIAEEFLAWKNAVVLGW